MQDLGQDLLLQLGQRLGHQRGQLILLGRAAHQSGRDRGVLGAGVGVAVRVACAIRRARGRLAGPDLVVADAQEDQFLHRAGIDVAADHGDQHRVTRDGPGRLAVQPGPAIPRADRGGRPRRRPAGPVLGDPSVLQDAQSLIHLAELGEVDVDQGLDRLPGPLGQQIRGQQPPHRLPQRVMIALRPGPQVPAARRGRQRIQHRLHHRRALRGQIPADHPGPLERRVKRHAPVQVPVVLILGVRRRGPVPDLRADRGQRPQVRPGPGRRHQELLGLVPVLRGDGAGPPGQLQRHRLV